MEKDQKNTVGQSVVQSPLFRYPPASRLPLRRTQGARRIGSAPSASSTTTLLHTTARPETRPVSSTVYALVSDSRHTSSSVLQTLAAPTFPLPAIRRLPVTPNTTVTQHRISRSAIARALYTRSPAHASLAPSTYPRTRPLRAPSPSCAARARAPSPLPAHRRP